MRPDALVRVVALLLRSRPFRALLVVSVLATMVAIGTSTSVAALRLSPEQQAISTFGATRAYIQPLNPPLARPGEPVADLPAITELGGRVVVLRVTVSDATLMDRDDEPVSVNYLELDLPSPVFDERIALADGRWPSVAGECVASPEFGDFSRAPIGTWRLEMVGRVSDLYTPGATFVACAPGTWQRWHVPPAEADLTGYVAQNQYYLGGDPGEAARVAADLVERTGMGPSEVMVRDESAIHDNPSATRFLFDQAPMFAIPLVLALVLGGLVARWGGAVSRALERVGVARKPMRLAILTSAVLGSGLAASGGALMGALLAAAGRPFLVAWVAEQPLSPWRLLVGEIVAVIVATSTGTAIGCWFGDVSGSRRLRQVDAPMRPLSSRARAGLVLAATALAVVSVWLAATSASYLWPMVLAAIAMVGAASCLAPVVVLLVGDRLAAGRVSAKTLAGRILVDDAARWGTVSAAVTALLGLVVAVFLVASSAVAGMQKLTSSRVPPGTVLLQVVNADGDHIPEQVRAQFERDLDVSSPVRLVERDVAVPGSGILQFFSSMADAEQTLGVLSPDARDTLARGGVLVLGGLQGSTTTIEVDGSINLDVPLGAIKPDPARRLHTGFGFAILPNMPAQVQSAALVSEFLVYQGLSPAQDEQARTWAATTGFNVFDIECYAPPQTIGLSATIGVGLAGFGLLAAPLLAGVLRREVHELRPLAGTLHSVGLSRTWIRPTFTTSVMATAIPASVLAILGPTIVVAMLSGIYPTVFDLQGVPWWALLAFIAGVVGACYLAQTLAVRTLHRRQAPVTI